jgi:hypothetical protein
MYWDPISVQAKNKFWPLPNLNTLTVSNNLHIPQKTIIDKDQFNEHIDFNESAKSQWFGRFGWTDDFTVLPQLPLSGTTIYTTSKQYMASNTCVLSPTKVNEFRFGYSRLINNNAQELSGKRDVVKELGLPYATLDPPSWGIPTFSGFNLGLSAFGNNSNGPFPQRQDCSGAGQLLLGPPKAFAPIRRRVSLGSYNNFGNQFSRRQFTFNGLYTANPQGLVGGNSAADLLMGTMSRTDLAIGVASGDFHVNSVAAYLDDTYRVTSKLTVTLGMRWEVVQPWKDDLPHAVNYQFQTGLPAAVNVDPSLHPVLVRTGKGDFHDGVPFR